jgi:hypothetical protein
MHEYENKIRRGQPKDEALINAVAAIMAAAKYPEVVD